MPPQVFFHIGLHKTASGWFQNRLFPNLQGLALYQEARREALISLLSRHHPGKLLISHEGLSGTLRTDKKPGDSTARLNDNLATMAQLAPSAGILIAFREHQSWINSAYAQRSKKRSTSAQEYVASFSPEDLLWCRKLELIAQRFDHVFPFLYEELQSDPISLVEDLSRFLQVPMPGDLQTLLKRHDNPSPRSVVGQLLSRPFFKLSYTFDRHPYTATKPVREFGARLGAGLDRLFPAKPIEFPATLAERLSQDWTDLKRIVSSKRRRNL